MRFCSVALLASLAACQPSAPEAPTWFQDVQPLVMANCARCHGADPESSAISGFRLDRYVKNDPTTLDAYDYRETMVRLASGIGAPTMPPTYALSELQRATLKRWLELGAPKGERNNRVPQVQRLEPAESSVTVDQLLALTLRAWDEDADGLSVRVGIREVGSPEIITRVSTGSGIRQVSIDTGVLPSGRTYEVIVVLDDGFADDPLANAYPVVLLPDVRVDHGARGTAPSVQLLNPNAGGTLSGAAEIAWVASDPDGDSLTIDLELIEVAADGSEKLVESIAPDLSNVPSSYTWDVTSVPATRAGQPIWYRVRVVARDGVNVRSDESDVPFTIAASPTQVTSYTWADVQPVFLNYCSSCHGEPAALGAPESFRLDKYDASDPVAPVNADLGVYEMRARVYDRMVVLKTMPPAYEAQPSAAEIAMAANWIEGGAPKGSSQQDAPPTFSWVVPNNSTVSTTSTGSVSLGWRATDPEGQPFQSGTIAYAPLSARADRTAYCDASLTAWTTIAGADVTAGSYVVTLPGKGYFCFRGEVTDAAGHTATAIAARPVKY